jgi:DNA-directed RNA polymerase subunit alpha
MSTDVAIDLDRALDSALSDVGEALQLRRRAANQSDLRSALRALLQTPPTSPDLMDANTAARRATARFLLGQDARVGELAKRTESHRVHYIWGLAELNRDRPLPAIAAFERCLEIEPRDDKARLRLAALQALCGFPDKARDTLGALGQQTDRPQVLYALGAIAEANGEYAEARRLYDSALAQDPEHVDTLFRLAYQHDLSGDDDAAIALYERARRVKPTRANILLNLGVLYEDRDDYDKAAECYRGVLVQFPNHPRAVSFLRDAESSRSMVVDEDMERKEDRRNQLLRTPISDFELSVRSRNCLAKMNIQSLGDLIQRTGAALLSYKNFGESSLQEIKDILTSKGLRLGMRREEVLAHDSAMITLPDIPEDDVADMSDLLDMPISDLDLSVRSSKCMSQLSVSSVRDLTEMSETELLRIKNFGVTSLQEIKTKLAKMGLGLRK